MKAVWTEIENRQVLARIDQQEQKTKESAALAEEKEEREYEMDAQNPAHNQGRTYQIQEDSLLLSLRGEPPAKNAGQTEEPDMGEEEGKGKELQAAKAAENQKKAKEASDAKVAAAKNAAVNAVKAKKAAEAQDKADLKPDGTIHRGGKRYFWDGRQAVGGVNDYVQLK